MTPKRKPKQQPIHVAPEHVERVREGLAWLRERESKRKERKRDV